MNARRTVASLLGLVFGLAAPAAAETPTFAKDVAPILYRSCVACHRPGEIGPMSLITYAEVRPWARAIREKDQSREMPPWHAEAGYLPFRNDRSLTEREISTVVRWASEGAPQGDSADLPQLPDFAEGWQIGKPDAVFEMPVDFSIPTTGVIGYKSYNVATNFTR